MLSFLFFFIFRACGCGQQLRYCSRCRPTNELALVDYVGHAQQGPSVSQDEASMSAPRVTTMFMLKPLSTVKGAPLATLYSS